MNFQYTNPNWLFALPPALAWVFWLAWKSDVSVSAWRRWLACGLRFVVATALILALAGVQWKRPLEGMNVVFLLDRSDSIPSPQQELSREFVLKAAAAKKPTDK